MAKGPFSAKSCLEQAQQNDDYSITSSVLAKLFLDAPECGYMERTKKLIFDDGHLAPVLVLPSLLEP
jgi:hypothetical protein